MKFLRVFVSSEFPETLRWSFMPKKCNDLRVRLPTTWSAVQLSLDAECTGRWSKRPGRGAPDFLQEFNAHGQNGSGGLEDPVAKLVPDSPPISLCSIGVIPEIQTGWQRQSR
jgi:hypothetical protein